MEATERAKKKEEKPKGFSGTNDHRQPSSKFIEKRSRFFTIMSSSGIIFSQRRISKGAAEEEGWEPTLQDPHNGSAKDITRVLALQYSG